MTAQLSDTVLYRGREFTLAGINGQGLFEPREHGVTPDTSWSNCRSDFYYVYEVVEEALRLKDAYVMLDRERPLLFGRKPVHVPKDYVYVYRGLQVPVAFTGTLLLASGFISSLGVNMGFQPAWKFEEVHELLMEAGQVVCAEDRSAHIAQARELLSGQPGPMTPGDRRELEAWVARCFRLDYTYW